VTRTAFAILALLVLGACASNEVHRIDPADFNAADQYIGGGRSPNPSGSEQVTLYMVEGNHLVPVARSGRSQLPRPELVVRALLSGPTRNELGMGLSTTIPAAVELSGVTVQNGVAQVDFNSAFSVPGDDYLLRLAQVVYTLSQLDGVEAVLFYTEHHQLPVPDQNHQQHGDPVSKARYSRFGPRDPFAVPVSKGPLRLDLPGDEEAAAP
jgi:spore germination protein GerM